MPPHGRRRADFASAQAVRWTPGLRHRRQGHDAARDAAGDCARPERPDGRPGAGERAGAVSPRGQCDRSSRGRHRVPRARANRGLVGDLCSSARRGCQVCRASGKSRAPETLAGFGRRSLGQDAHRYLSPGTTSRKEPGSSSARYPRPLADWKRLDTSVHLQSCWVNNCFLSLRPRTRGRSSCRRTASSHSWAAARCCVPRRLNGSDRRGRGARRRADRAGRRHGYEPAVPAGQRRTGFPLSRLREDCASHQGA